MSKKDPPPWAAAPPDPLRDRDQRLREIERRRYYHDHLFLPVGALPQRKLEWLVEGFLPEGYLTLLGGPPKSGKTCIATAIAIGVATGTDFAGRRAKQGGVLWIAGEESPTERDLILTRSPLVDPSTPIYTCYQPLHLEDEECLAVLRQWVVHAEARLVVVDPLMACISGFSLRESWNARRALQPLKRFCDLNGVSALVLHHAKRGAERHHAFRVADNDQLSATAAMSLILRSQPAGAGEGGPAAGGPAAGGGPRLVALSCEGRGMGLSTSFRFLSAGPLDYKSLDPLERRKAPRNKPSHAELAVLKTLAEGPMDSQQIVAGTRIPASSARNAVTNLRRSGKIVVLRVQGRRRIYALWRAPSQPDAGELAAAPNDYPLDHPIECF